MKPSNSSSLSVWFFSSSELATTFCFLAVGSSCNFGSVVGASGREAASDSLSACSFSGSDDALSDDFEPGRSSSVGGKYSLRQ